MLIDVRAPSAYKIGHGVGTINIPRGPLELIPSPEDELLEKNNTNKKI